MREYVIAKYIRLSLDDKQTDSVSIPNQREILNRAIADLPGLENVRTLEFIDNGCSGTNFERPAVQELLTLVKQGEINCIMVKDFSRFGRNQIEMGYFIEQVFPLYRTRFISVSDDFDSGESMSSTGGVDIAFKFLMHEYYSRDLSKKIKTAKRTKMLRGDYQSGSCIYGYSLNEKRRLVIDSEAAENVRMIFNMVIEGKTPGEIKKILFDLKIPTPGEYKAMHGRRMEGISPGSANCIWSSCTLLNGILTDERYTGVYISGKTKIVDLESHRQIKADESEWIRIPDHHPAIISRETFEQAQEAMKAFSREQGYKPRGERIYPLKGKVYCGCCGRAMQRDPIKSPIYRCRRTKVDPTAECHNLTVREQDIERLLITVIRKQIKVFLNLDNVEQLSVMDIRQAEQQELNNRIERLEEEKRRLFEDLIMGDINAGCYQTRKSEIDMELSRIRGIHSAVAAKTEQLQAESKKREELHSLAKLSRYKRSMTPELANLLIEKVLLFPDNRVEVVWKFDEFIIQPNEVNRTQSNLKTY